MPLSMSADNILRLALAEDGDRQGVFAQAVCGIQHHWFNAKSEYFHCMAGLVVTVVVAVW